MKRKNVLRIVLSSPNDVVAERDRVELVIAELNKGLAADYNVLFETVRWETDAFPGFHKKGPQGLIDPVLDIAQCDILIGIFAKRFGTPTQDAESGTEHEFINAYKSWQEKESPQIMIYFKDAEFRFATSAQVQQYQQVIQFREKFPKEGLYWLYQDITEFERLVRQHLIHYLKHFKPGEHIIVGKDKERINERQIIQRYCRNIKERFSRINLFGEGQNDNDDLHNAPDRMTDMESGFVLLNLQDWLDDTEIKESPPLNITELFFTDAGPRHFLIRGLPGSGKTTLLRYLVHHFAGLGASGVKECIPVYMRCKDIGKNDSLEEFVLQQINQQSETKICYETLTGPNYFLESPMVCLFDGLDEIEETSISEHIGSALVALKKKYPRCTIIVTSRPIKLRREDYPSFRHLDLLRLGDDLIDDYLNRWFGKQSKKMNALKQTIKTRPRIHTLATNPFLLSMICFTYARGGETALIERRSDLYANCTIFLLQRGYDSSFVKSETKYEQVLGILKDISLRFFLWQEADFSVDHVNVIGRRYLTADEIGKTEDFLDDIQRQTGLLQRAQEGFTFVHRSLWEYFTALALLDKRSFEFVIRHAANPDWEEVVRLYAGLLPEDNDVMALVNGLWTINRPLALRVTTEVHIPAKKLVKPLVEKEEGNQAKLLLIDSLEQSLPLVPQDERHSLLQETLTILLIECEEKDCEVIYHAEQLLHKQKMSPLQPGGIIYQLLQLEKTSQRQQRLLDDAGNLFQWIEVKGGQFWMGDDEHETDERPAHEVQLSRFCMSKHPVTNKMLASFPLGQKYPNYGGESHPAIGNTWWEAYYFALWLGARLPTEAEWEYAVRGGPESRRTQYFYGDSADELKEFAWFGETERKVAHAVDEKNPLTGKENLNSLGVANMAGNVWEWCADWYDGDYYKENKERGIVENPTGPEIGSYRVLRGGGWSYDAQNCRSAYRNINDPGDRSYGVGFRLVFVPQ
ncbi:SUMF1/EgtB/PvdO family nonheme iron enzyme [candidate division KSB1 bacterium]|nr:SUMF1/EgtB/PvdO family nonheme iron enzyme [candidate division KSB1 bacterium]